MTVYILEDAPFRDVFYFCSATCREIHRAENDERPWQDGMAESSTLVLYDDEMCHTCAAPLTGRGEPVEHDAPDERP